MISGCDNFSDKDGKRTQRYNDIWDEKEGLFYLYLFLSHQG
jgi:hypothetical protein